MVFASLIFIFVFLPLNILLYFIWGNRTYRNLVLVAFSLFFYAWGEPVWVGMLVFSSFMDYLNGRLLNRWRGTRLAKLPVIFSVVLNLSLLAIFKYSGFLVENLNALLGLGLTIPAFSLPIGISFYSFQSLSYVIDNYRGEVETQRSYLKYLMYVSLYPQLVAGPIVRYSHVAHEIDNRVTDIRDISAGITRFCVGLAKKVMVANVAGQFVTQYMDGDLTKLSVLGAWFGAVMFTLQIYYDFSGYSDMAIGLGMIFGFHYYENFNYPYISRSATEFWRRWHISLGSFFRDYLYIPLGGNRKHQYLNLLIVWFCTGLWHGASWNFILWGLYFGILIMVEKKFLLNLLNKMPRIISHLYLLFVVVVGWVLFYFTDIHRMWSYLGVMFGISAQALTDLSTTIVLVNNVTWIVWSLLFCMPLVQIFKYLVNDMERHKQGLVLWLQPLFNLLILGLCTALLVGQSYNPFLYFRF